MPSAGAGCPQFSGLPGPQPCPMWGHQLRAMAAEPHKTDLCKLRPCTCSRSTPGALEGVAPANPAALVQPMCAGQKGLKEPEPGQGRQGQGPQHCQKRVSLCLGTGRDLGQRKLGVGSTGSSNPTWMRRLQELKGCQLQHSIRHRKERWAGSRGQTGVRGVC